MASVILGTTQILLAATDYTNKGFLKARQIFREVEQCCPYLLKLKP